MPDAEPRGFAAIALGKQGSRELNYSSDIDPILLFDPATLPRRAREEPEEAAVRIGARVVELLQARDGDGYVLRVDLRLRPSPEVTPIALPVDAAIGYYESQALPWERAAFIRARAAAGDIGAGRAVPRRDPAVRLAARARFRRDRRDPRDLAPHPRSSCAGPGVRARLRPEARARRHPRGRVLRADPPADPRRPRSGAARARDARRAGARWRRRAGSTPDEAAALSPRPTRCCARSSTACR